MKKKLSILLLGVFMSSLCLAQGYEKTKADSLRDEGQLQLAIEEHAKVYKEDPANKDNTYNYACALALTRQVDSAFHYLNIAVEKDTSVRPLTDPDFYFLIEDERWGELQDKLVEKVEVVYGKYENLPLAKELWTMKAKDQAFYYHLNVAEKATGRQSPVVNAIWELKHLINQGNVSRIEEIIATHGWPKRSVVKDNAASTAFLIVQHADLEIQKKYLPIMTEAANNQEASWSSLALLIDRINLREGKQQIYGSQIGRNKEGKFHVQDLFEPEYVNQRRKEVGLGPIEDYIKRWGVEWTVVQKEK